MVDNDGNNDLTKNNAVSTDNNAVVPGNGGTGDPCLFDDDCAGGFCIDDGNGSNICSQDCGVAGTPCPNGFDCELDLEAGVNLCIPGAGGDDGDLCTTCDDDAQCGGTADRCLPLANDPEVSVCAKDCSVGRDDDCPADYVCMESILGIDVFIYQCVPINGFCPFNVDDADEDTVTDSSDNCPLIPNLDQADRDGDGVGDDCDNCPNAPNPTQDASVCDPALGEIVLHPGQFHGGGNNVGASANFRVAGSLGTREPKASMSSANFQVQTICVGPN